VKPHRTDLVSLSFGLVFLAAAGLWLAGRLVTLDARTVGWFVAGSLVLLGGAGLAHVLVTHRRRSDHSQ
jgi:hypothetical protein